MIDILNADFLKALFPNLREGLIEFRLISEKVNSEFLKQNDIDGIQRIINQYNGKKNVYFGIATRKDASSGKKENCNYLSAIFIDIDCGTDGHKKASWFKTKDDALAHLERLDLGQSIVVDSGHGLHIYWLLNKPLELTAENIQKAENLMKKIGMILYLQIRLSEVKNGVKYSKTSRLRLGKQQACFCSILLKYLRLAVKPVLLLKIHF